MNAAVQAQRQSRLQPQPQPQPTQPEAGFSLEQGVYVPAQRPQHRDDEYDPAGFDQLLAMQRDHFWYRGRHRLLLNLLRHEIRRAPATGPKRAIDLGGGCGGWIEYLHRHDPGLAPSLALGDSSMRALQLAAPVVSSYAQRYQIDLLNLGWSETWDLVFLLDVIEHIPEHVEVLRQARESLRPGGLLLVTTPALQAFWTYNDELAHHQRRYNKQDFRDLAEATGLTLLRSDYFMFLLSPALLLSRLLSRPAAQASPEQLQALMARTHRIPPRPVNALLAGVLAAEAMGVNHISYPWGTSIVAVFRR